MALRHATSGEIVEIRPLGGVPEEVPSTAIVRDEHVEVMRLVLAAGRNVPEHEVPGPLTLHCLEGAIDVLAHNETKRLRAGQLMYLSGGVAYALRGVEDASVLATMVRLPSAP